LCDRDIATNFGAVAGEVLLVDSCAIIFIYCDCYLFFLKKKRNRIFACNGIVHLRQRYCLKQILAPLILVDSCAIIFICYDCYLFF